MDSHWSVPNPELTKLEIIPRPFTDRSEQAAQPTIIAAFVGQDGLGGGDYTHTIITRWELADTVQGIDTSFSQLSSKRASSMEAKVRVIIR